MNPTGSLFLVSITHKDWYEGTIGFFLVDLATSSSSPMAWNISELNITLYKSGSTNPPTTPEELHDLYTNTPDIFNFNILPLTSLDIQSQYPELFL